MTTQNSLDDQIRSMLTKVQERTKVVEDMKAKATAGWVTNCSFWKIGASTPMNLQTASAEDIAEAAAHLCLLETAYEQAGKRLKRDWQSAKYRGSPVADWFADLDKRLAKIEIGAEEQKLNELTKRLNGVLSPDERRRIEVEMLLREV